MTNNIPLTPSAKSLERFLEHIQSAGVPEKVNGPYLKGVGFKSGNDSYLVPILKYIGFLDGSGAPTKEWKSYRNKPASRRVLGDGVRSGYSELFRTYPDADRRDEEAIHNWIRANSDYDENKVQLAVATFRTLVKHADFDSPGVPPTTDGENAAPKVDPVLPVVPIPAATGGSGPTININIELHLPPSEDGVSYEKLFEAMKTHLFPDGRTAT